MSDLIRTPKDNKAIREFLQATPRIYSVCKNLFDNFDVNHFAYIKFINNGRMLRLSSDAEWSKHYYANFFYENLKFYRNQLEHKKNISARHVNYCLWDQDTYNKDCVVYFELQKYNMGNGFSIYIRGDTSVESFHFASALKDVHMSNFYINNLTIFESFILFFKYEIRNLEDFFREDMLLKIPDENLYQGYELPVFDVQQEQFPSKKYLFELENTTIYISKREFECLYLLAIGKQCKEIAQILDISPRTVECYINSLKTKTNLMTTAKIIKIFIERNLSKWYSHYNLH